MIAVIACQFVNPAMIETSCLSVHLASRSRKFSCRVDPDGLHKQRESLDLFATAGQSLGLVANDCLTSRAEFEIASEQHLVKGGRYDQVGISVLSRRCPCRPIGQMKERTTHLPPTQTM